MHSTPRIRRSARTSLGKLVRFRVDPVRMRLFASSSMQYASHLLGWQSCSRAYSKEPRSLLRASLLCRRSRKGVGVLPTRLSHYPNTLITLLIKQSAISGARSFLYPPQKKRPDPFDPAALRCFHSLTFLLNPLRPLRHVVEDVVQRVTVQPGLEPLLIEVVSQKADRSAKDEQGVEAAGVVSQLLDSWHSLANVLKSSCRSLYRLRYTE